MGEIGAHQPGVAEPHAGEIGAREILAIENTAAPIDLRRGRVRAIGPCAKRRHKRRRETEISEREEGSIHGGKL